jgi:uncharacterized membrane protein YeaQ/YmgE (transglycosylase-associated protein family)
MGGTVREVLWILIGAVVGFLAGRLPRRRVPTWWLLCLGVTGALAGGFGTHRRGPPLPVGASYVSAAFGAIGLTLLAMLLLKLSGLSHPAHRPTDGRAERL